MIRENTVLREAISLEKRVAVALFRLATGSYYHTVAKVFGVSPSLVNKIVLEFCTVMNIIADGFIKFPATPNDTQQYIQKFQEFGCPIPQVVGCIDGTHIKIKCPDVPSKQDYYNRKQTYSVNTQGVVGENYKFLNVSTGFPGGLHDSRVLRISDLYDLAERGLILNEPVSVILNVGIRPLLLGDSAYPPSRWILKPYTRNRNLNVAERHLNVAERHFNFVLSQ